MLADTSNGNIEKPKLEDTNISSLLFADDLAIFSLSQEELQNKINILEEYCYKWGLELNMKKTKIIIFNKQGANIKRFKFYYRDNEIEMTYRFRKTLENTYEGVQSRKAFSMQLYKNRLLHKYEAKISEAHSQKFAPFFQLIW